MEELTIKITHICADCGQKFESVPGGRVVFCDSCFAKELRNFMKWFNKKAN